MSAFLSYVVLIFPLLLPVCLCQSCWVLESNIQVPITWEVLEAVDILGHNVAAFESDPGDQHVPGEGFSLAEIRHHHHHHDSVVNPLAEALVAAAILMGWLTWSWYRRF